ncbi:Homoserine dehydrogenase [Penicillium diatomitis]|uniref:Homoserine dehydrogenase n=1 Tax=Penicillium diatomitis TaxID=2819901 RepID=A0A9W9WUW7_9EURO|nr:Homoserine dehydrogenase [Penicillium diatomitis]KAJ5477183.1 Homoserine dehydrogenase [Penicillium diatomitis]
MESTKAAGSQVFLGIIGVGVVGNAFLEQLERLPYPPKLILLARSSKTVSAPAPEFSPCVPFAVWDEAVKLPQLVHSNALPPAEIAAFLSSAPGKAILVDNTSDLTLARAYPLFLERGVSIVTPNKKGFSEDMALFNQIFSSAAQGNAAVYHQCTVGGTLPVLSTLRDLVATGDQITRVEGVLSGTLSLLLGDFMPGNGTSEASWSSLVSHAKEIGHTEPDPRDDLNGLDFARKLTIIARVIGMNVSRHDSFPVESLVPDELSRLPSSSAGIARFMEELPRYDGVMEEAKREAKKQGKILRYTGSIDVLSGAIKVGLQFVEAGSAIANLRGSQIVNIYTKRYGAHPLILQGGGVVVKLQQWEYCPIS